jgi:nitrogen fixation NifU-like protein
VSQAHLELYQSVILDHNRNPRGYGDLAGATHQAEGFNPICGDRVQIQIEALSGEIRDIRFTAQCCALCRASSSVLVELMTGRSVDIATALVGSFEGMIQGDAASPIEDLKASSAQAFFATKDFPARAKCVLLPWRTFMSALAGEKTISTESKE